MARACPHCGCTEVDKDPARGDSVCTGCGSVLEDTIIINEVQFAEGAGGGSSVIGQFVSAEGSGAPIGIGGAGGYHAGVGRESRQVTLQKGKSAIQELAGQLKLNQHCIDIAFNFFKMAVNRRITRGRKQAHVIAACLYLVCRTEGTPHMLLDFSDVLQVNVYELGRTYLSFAKTLNIQIPAIDPSLLIPRFANKLQFGEKEHEVSMTAMRIISRMKRDWMAIGRRPSGLCGAALLVASRIHNFCRTKQDIIKIVKVCDQTIRKRLLELEDTASSKLTIDQFQTIDLEEEADPPAFTASRRDAKIKKLDEHLNQEVENEIQDVSKEIDSALESKRVRAYKEKEKKLLEMSEISGDLEIEDPAAQEFLEREVIQSSINRNSPIEDDQLMPPPRVDMRPTSASLGINSRPVFEPEVVDNGNGELDLEGLDDDELNGFILTKNEVETKEKVWMALNGEFLKEYEEKMRKRAEEEASKPPKKKRPQKQKFNRNHSTAGEAMEQMLQEKKLSNKINYDALKKLTNPARKRGNTEESMSTQDEQTNNNIRVDTSNAPKPELTPTRAKCPKKEPANSKPSLPSTEEMLGVRNDTCQLIIESGPVTQHEQHLEQEDEELYEEDVDEPVSAAQLFGHTDDHYDDVDDEEY